MQTTKDIIAMKRFTLFLLMIAGLLSGRASETWNQFLTVETDTAEYVAPKDTTVYLPPVDTTHYEPVDTGEVVRPDVPSKPVIYVPTIHEGDNVTEFPHNPAVDACKVDICTSSLCLDKWCTYQISISNYAAPSQEGFIILPPLQSILLTPRILTFISPDDSLSPYGILNSDNCLLTLEQLAALTPFPRLCDSSEAAFSWAEGENLYFHLMF